MANLNGFIPVEPANDFDPIPTGKYVAVITSSEMKPTKAGTGAYLELSFQIVDGEFRNRLLWTRLNLENKNATAVQIARADLSAICRSVGVLEPKDSSELHNLPLVILVKQKDSDDGKVRSEIRGYFRHEIVAAAKPPQPEQSMANNGIPF